MTFSVFLKAPRNHAWLDQVTRHPPLDRYFFRGAILIVLTLGAAWGAMLLAKIAAAGSLTAAGLQEVNAHGHAQIFGWLGLFVMGCCYSVLPRLLGTHLTHPRWALASFWLMIVGVVVHSMFRAAAARWAWLGMIAVAGSSAEIAAIGILVAVVFSLVRNHPVTRGAFVGYLTAALVWFFLQAIYETVYFVATLLASNHDSLLNLVATWQGPLREIQIYGFAMLAIYGISQRLLPEFYELPEPGPRKSRAILAVLNVAVVGIAAGLILMRSAGHAWAALWYFSVLALVGASAVLVGGWGLYGPVNRADHSLKFIRAAYAWLFGSLGMLALLPAYQFAVLPRLAPGSRAVAIGFSHAYYGAIRHAITVGFISLAILGIAARVVPQIRSLRTQRLNSLWAPFLLVNAGCAIRVAGQVLTDITPSAYSVTGVSGFLEWTGLAIWGVHLWGLMAVRDPQALREPMELSTEPEPRSARPEENCMNQPISANDVVADIIDRHPGLLPSFLDAGFTPLKNPVIRNRVARLVTLRQACEKMGVDLASFLDTLNRQCRDLPRDSGLHSSRFA